MSGLTSVPIASIPLQRFESVLDRQTYGAVLEHARWARELFAGRALWNVNSTARGGGVAEMVQSLLAYARGQGVDARWEVIAGDPAFFVVTKRLHNHLHGNAGDGGRLDGAAREVYEETTRANAEALAERMASDDAVLLHDPQTAGMIPVLKQLGVPVVWRCHVGLDRPHELTAGAWDFLRGYVRQADAYVFSRPQYVWDELDRDRTVLIPPSIDAFSAKNQDLAEDTVHAILDVAGLQEDGAARTEASFTRIDGSPGRVERRAEIDEGRPLRSTDPVVLQVSRWDRLKDPLGVLTGFVRHVLPHTDAHLVYAGPSVEAVADDPEGRQVLDEARELFAGLPAAARERVHLVSLPMTDLEENAAMVNALQRRADVVVQKSIAEGFGLTVAEAMWKSRPVVASRIGGIQDQIEHPRSGLLVDDPADLAAYGRAVTDLVRDAPRAVGIGGEARRRVADQYLGTRSLVQYTELFARLLPGR
ncbi:glycosyltransferase [Trujillonella endophytica]|uniref:Trehalose synthase n=1 Tax=Trujillonella endophytica TaxID=673521 RepID=A0A1H8PJ05_9ACTN|nr:glycosyltransferase [Trujillella endophytica]SEO41910.1 trehalose synthase [Trujillella endophytica]